MYSRRFDVASCLALLGLGTSLHANAVLLDFEDRAGSPQGVASLIYPDATLTSSTGDLSINGADLGRDICAFAVNCVGVRTVDFAVAANGLTFNSDGEWGRGGLLSSAEVEVKGVFAATSASTTTAVSQPTTRST